MLCKGRLKDFLSGKAAIFSGYDLTHLFCKYFRGCYQHGGGIGVMLDLGQKIDGDQFRFSGVIGQDQRLAGTCWRVYIHLAIYQHLCGRHILIARTYDLVHSRNGPCTIGQAGDTPRAAHLENTLTPSNVSGHQCGGVRGHSLSGGCYGNDVPYARYLGGQDRHENRAGVCRSPSRDIAPHNIHCPCNPTCQDTFAHLY